MSDEKVEWDPKTGNRVGEQRLDTPHVDASQRVSEVPQNEVADDEPGDSTPDPELKQHLQQQPDQPDQVDQPDQNG